jgi:hypothetical protein
MAPQPDSALRRLDRLVGRWTMDGNLVGSDEKNITGADAAGLVIEELGVFRGLVGRSAVGDQVIRVGVLTPHAAIGPEAEFPAIAPGRIEPVVARVSAERGSVDVGASRWTAVEALADPGRRSARDHRLRSSFRPNALDGIIEQ